MDRPQHHSPKKVKRFRSAFTTDQVNYLEKQFKKFPYIGNAHRKEVALSLNIPERAVKIWFQNRRMKEKKDGSNKEFDILQSIPKSLEFAKSQLNNASVVSANDQQMRSLPLLNDVNQSSYDNDMVKAKFTNDMSVVVDSGVNNTKVKVAPVSQHVITTKVVHPPPVFLNNGHLNQDPRTPSVNLDLCKKLKTEAFKPYIEPALKKEIIEPKKFESISPIEQTAPEDLSASRKPIYSPMIQPPYTNAGYVSIMPTVSPFYAQPYISASGVVWKPVSVLPVVPSPATQGNTVYDMSDRSTANRSCNCDCHVNSQMSYNYPQQSSPRYIITSMPFQNPSTKF